MATRYRIRDATDGDLATLVDFTIREARDSADLALDVDAVERGVRAGLGPSAQARYWVAECPEGQVVASTSVVTEWSNFRGSHYWWIQSLYVRPEHRGTGLVDTILHFLAEASATAGAVDLRLYAERTNTRALAAYRRCGFTIAPYTIMTRQHPPSPRDDNHP